MNMKRIIMAILLCTAAVSSCKSEYTTYEDAEYIMFADSMSVNMVQQGDEYFQVPVVSTVSRNYDRTIAVEIIDKGSNAIEGHHYRLRSNTLTIPANQTATYVEVQGIYDNIEPTDSLGFTLKLIVPEEVKWNNLYTDETKVVMYKSCPFNLEEFTGWCVVTSTFLNSYPGQENSSYQRLIQTERHPSQENTIIMKNWLFNGFDVSMKFNPENPAESKVTMDEGQVISTEMPVFGIVNGDNKILVKHSPYNTSYFNACQRYVLMYNIMYVENLGETVGTVGEFIAVMEWVSDEEADRLKREAGM